MCGVRGNPEEEGAEGDKDCDMGKSNIISKPCHNINTANDNVNKPSTRSAATSSPSSTTYPNTPHFINP